MPEPKPLPTAILLHTSKLLNVPLKGMAAVIALLDEGATVPFIARYRKEVSGNLDEVQIRDIQEKLEYFRELEERRETVLQTIEEQGKLTPELRARIEACLEKAELEDLYLPYKPKRRTKATIAREKGLEPLAQYLWNQQTTEQPVELFAQFFVNEERGVSSVDEALVGARHIIAEWISETAEFRKSLRQLMLTEGFVASHKIEDASDAEGKFAMYADYREPARKIPSHRMLAIRRGEKENVLSFQIELEPDKPIAYLNRHVIREQGDWVPHLEAAVEDAWKRLLNSSIQTDVRIELKERSDTEAIRVFR